MKRLDLKNNYLARAFVVGCSLLSIASCSSSPPLYKETQLLMGTTVEVTIEGEKETASEVSKKFFDRVKEFEAKFSLYNPESEIVRVNKEAGHARGAMQVSKILNGVKVSPEFYELLEKSLIYSELTSGAFDISVAPFVKLWGFKEHKPDIPKEEDIRKTSERCGYTSIILSDKEQKVSFSNPGIEIDMSAIAKGYIVEEGVKFLKTEGVKAALINAGGDIYCMGRPAGKEGWRVAIRHPRKKNMTIAQLTLSDKAVATSGDYENYFLHEGKYLSHIIDPRTGWPSNSSVVSATVISSDGAEADALATALMVMDKKKGIDLINHLEGVEGIIVSLKEDKFAPVASAGLEGKIRFEL